MSSINHDRIRPAASSPRGSYLGTVKRNVRLCTDHYCVTLALPYFPKSTPGQFVQIDCRDPHASGIALDLPPRTFEWGNGPSPSNPKLSPANPTDADFIAPLAYLRRPFSIADHRIWPDGYSELDIIHRVIGKGTLFLAQLQVGQAVSLLGPLGRGFDVQENLKLACLVGGGVGIPPMLFLAKALRDKYVDSAVAFIGAQREDLLPVSFTDLESSPEGDALLNVEEFAEYGYPAVISTDDGSRGMKGYITQALDRFLEERQMQQGDLAETVIFCCGPTPMMKATAKVAAHYNVPCQVSLEQPMACGMATCQSCVIKYRPRETPEADWKYKLTCTEGPVFDARDILW